MGNIEYNSLEDLVFSRSFRNWVLQENSSEAGFWESWVARHPEKTALIHHAKAIIYALQPNWQQLSEEDIDAEVWKILWKLEEDPADLRRANIRPLRARLRWLAAACLLGVTVFAGHRLYNGRRGKDVLKTFLAAHKNTTIQGADSVHVIDLPDGSRVEVGKGSHLYYGKDMATGGKREVFLSGEAFFDIRKDAARPFYVYTSQVITKVLGTSFRVEAFPSDQKTIVSVHTGKVSVYRKEDFFHGGNERGGIVVTPNQEMVYDEEKDHLNKLLTDEPKILTEARDSSLTFEATPVTRVFKKLQDVYGIPILYDEEAVASCSLSASLSTGSFYEKLNVICKAINASYEVIDGNIVVTAKGCK
jgi:ferric-dicitrate binding protein FerR (iron transport regulator)